MNISLQVNPKYYRNADAMLKQGKYLPGTSIKIKDPSEIQYDKPDYIFLFAWNFSKEIIDDLKNNFNFNGKLIIPIPDLRIIDIG